MKTVIIWVRFCELIVNKENTIMSSVCLIEAVMILQRWENKVYDFASHSIILHYERMSLDCCLQVVNMAINWRTAVLPTVRILLSVVYAVTPAPNTRTGSTGSSSICRQPQVRYGHLYKQTYIKVIIIIRGPLSLTWLRHTSRLWTIMR